MSSFSWDEDGQRVVSMEGYDDDSDPPSSCTTSKPLSAWETVDNDEVDKAQAAHTFDLSTLFNFVPRDGKGSGSGYDDQMSLATFATGTSKLTMNIDSFQEPTFQDNEEIVIEYDDTDMLPPPVKRIPVSSLGAASSISALNSDFLQSIPNNTESVSSAPPSIQPQPNSPTQNPPHAGRGEAATPAASAASLQKTGVDHADD